jgi:hypothetical protein
VSEQATLSWDLPEAVEYSPGEVLECTLTLANLTETARKLYVLGGLFFAAGEPAGTSFGVYAITGADYAVNDPDWVTVWEVPAGETGTIPCRLTLSNSDAVLVLSLLEMAGEAPAADDTVHDSVSCSLSRPTSVWDFVLAGVGVVAVGGIAAVALKKM